MQMMPGIGLECKTKVQISPPGREKGGVPRGVQLRSPLSVEAPVTCIPCNYDMQPASSRTVTATGWSAPATREASPQVASLTGGDGRVPNERLQVSFVYSARKELEVRGSARLYRSS